ncbi:hypothetical protein [Nonomuraea sp. KM88]|uniref:hypothetical protein n=1 Tax=Nonomuraea sp. KM88 TaxID=3457427 RepID=UPI003FCC3A3E
MSSSFTYPAIPSQSAFRAIDRADPGLTTIVYERPIASQASPELLRQAVAEVYQRHEVLRTVIVDGEPGSPSSPLESLWLGYRNVVAERPVEALDVIAPEHTLQSDHGEPGWLPGLRADPGRLPVFRFQLIEGPVRRKLRILTDHALCDRWSLFVLQRDIERSYRRIMAGAPASTGEIYPFSTFARELYSMWTSGVLKDKTKALGEKITALDMSPLSEISGSLCKPASVESFVVALSSESTRRFEALNAQAGSSRLGVAIALFAHAVAAEFGWRRLALLTPHANRSLKARGSVGLFADAQYIFASVEAGLAAAVREVSTSLKETLTGTPPPAALIQALPGAREVLQSVPRLAADVQIRPRRGGPVSRTGRIELFEDAGEEDIERPDEDAIVTLTPPSWPGQPDLRLTCDFSNRHELSVNYRVDHIPASSARAIAQRLLRQIQRAGASGAHLAW